MLGTLFHKVPDEAQGRDRARQERAAGDTPAKLQTRSGQGVAADSALADTSAPRGNAERRRGTRVRGRGARGSS